MNVNGKSQTTIWLHPEDNSIVQIIDQRHLPHQFVVEDLKTTEDAFIAIKDMHVRGAPLIGVTAAYGMYLALCNKEDLNQAAEYLKQARPTAVNLAWAVDRVVQHLSQIDKSEWLPAALELGNQIREEEILRCKNIGEHGLAAIEEIAANKSGEVVNVLTHCNAGWLACVDYGTATAPIYLAHDKGINVHVWVDETRPRNQGASLTAWELGQHGVPHTVVCDNTGGHLMQNAMVDLAIVGTDRTTRCGNVANKIGTYLKALAAHDNNVPFYVAAPSSSIDWNIRECNEIPIEIRDEKEVTHILGKVGNETLEVQLTPDNSPALNYGFDVTPAKYVTGIITERGVSAANEDSLVSMFSDLV